MVLADKAFGVLYLESDPYPTRVATLVPMTRFPALSGSFKLSLIDTEDKVLDKVNFNSQIYGEADNQDGSFCRACRLPARSVATLHQSLWRYTWIAYHDETL